MNTKDSLIKIIKEQLDVKESEIKLEANFADDLGSDSLAMIEIIMAIEEEFGIEIPDEDTEKAKTVRDVIHYIDDILKSQSR